MVASGQARLALVSLATLMLVAGPSAGVALASSPSVVGTSPTGVTSGTSPVTVTFAEPVAGPPLSSLSVATVDGGSVTGVTSVRDSGHTLVWEKATSGPLASGVYTATFTARSAADHTAVTTGSFDFTVDSTAPATPTNVTVSPIDSVDAARAVTVSGDGDPGEQVELSVDDEDSATDAVTATASIGSTGAFSLSGLDLSGLADGRLDVAVVSFDALDNRSAAATQAVVKDTAAPAFVSASPPVNGGANSTSSVTVSYSEPLDTTASTITVLNRFGNALDGATQWSDSDKTVTFVASSMMTPIGSPYRVDVSVRDPSGKSAGVEYGFVIDDTAPETPTLAQPDPVSAANAHAVTVSGAAEPSSTVTVQVDESDVTTSVSVTRVVVADSATGAWSISGLDVRALPDGTLTVSASAKDLTGNMSGAAQRSVLKDTKAPSTPSGLSMTTPVHGGNQHDVMVSGRVDAGQPARISIDDSTPGAPVVVTASGNNLTGSFSVSGIDVRSLDDGELVATVTSADAVGNVSPEATVTAIKDAQAPLPPLATMTDPVNAGNSANVVVASTAEPSTQVELVVSDGTTTADPVRVGVSAQGNWSRTFDLSSYLDGTITVTARTVDSAANTGPVLTLTALKDTVAPAAPVVNAAQYANSATVSAYAITGTAEPSTVLKLAVAQGGQTIVRDLTVSAATGDFAADVDLTGFAEGAFTATVVATDAAGNTSPVSSRSATKDTRPPGVASVSAPGQPVTAATQRTVALTGAAEPGATVDVSVTDEASRVVTGSAPADGTGGYQTTVDVSSLADNYLWAVAVATDPAGNRGDAGTPVRVVKDTTQLALAAVAPGDGARVRAATVVAATANQVVDVAKSSIVLRDRVGGVLAGGKSAGAGDKGVVLTPTVTLTADGSPYSVVVTLEDFTGERVTQTTSFVVDVTPPAAPAIAQLAVVNAAAAAAMPVSGTAEPGGTVTVSVDDAGPAGPVSGQFAVGAGGGWSGTVDVRPLGDGTLTVTATAADAAGNSSPAAAAEVVKDATPPPAPAVALPARVSRESRSAVPVSGTAEPGASLTVAVDDEVTGDPVVASATADEHGGWAVTVDVTRLADGQLVATAIATDRVGNPSPAGTAATTKYTVRAATAVVEPVTPVSGKPATVRVTLHRDSDPASPADPTWAGPVTLASPGDSQFRPGVCAAPVAGTATCRDVVFGDLGAAVVTVTATTDDGLSTTAATAMVEPVALTWATTPSTAARRGQQVTYAVRPVPGVPNAEVVNYAGAPRVEVTGDGSSVRSGTALTCGATATCSISLSFTVGGGKTVVVVDDSSPPAITPTARLDVADPARLGLTAPRAITWGQSHQAGGRVVNGRTGAPVACAVVKLYARTYPATTYTYQRTVTTRSDGTYATTFRPPRNTVYRAVLAPTRTLDGAAVLRGVSVNALVVVRTPSTSTSTTRAGTTLRVTGYVRQAVAGQVVALVVRGADGRAVTVGAARTMRDGTWALTWRPGRGTWTVWVTARGTCCNTAGKSRAFSVRAT